MIHETSRQEKSKIIFFDGVCQLCNGFVDFLISRDSLRSFYYAPLQGETAKSILKLDDVRKLDSVIYSQNGETFYKSKAVSMIFMELPRPWKLLGLVGLTLPRFITDSIYDFVAKNRYQWFGKKDSCRIPTAEEKAYFLP